MAKSCYFKGVSMSFISDAFGGGDGGYARALFDPGDIAGTRAAGDAERSAEAQIAAAQLAIEEQQRAAAQGLGFLDPFAQLGQTGIDQASFLTDPNAQFEFLQNNPLFKLALDNANQATTAQAAAGGRLASGDTLQQLTSNAFLQAQPLLDRQIGGINNLLNLGSGIATTQANTALGVGSNISNLLTDQGAARAGGIAGAANARAQGTQNIIELGGTFFGASDSRLKDDAKIIGKKNGFNIWSWTWNKIAKDKFGLSGDDKGVMFSEVLKTKPEAVGYKNGYGMVNYDAIGVDRGSL